MTIRFNSIVLPQECPTGLVFNPATSLCDKPENVPSCMLNMDVVKV